MIDIELGLVKQDEKDNAVSLYEAIEIKGVAQPDHVVRSGFAQKIMGYLDSKYGSNEKFASLVEDSSVNFNEKRQTITLALEFKGADVAAADIIAAITQAVES